MKTVGWKGKEIEIRNENAGGGGKCILTLTSTEM
jgi:hypothetical protein